MALTDQYVKNNFQLGGMPNQGMSNQQDYSSLLMQLMKGGGNPLLMGLQGLAGGIGGMLSKSPAEKNMEWGLGQKKKMMPELKAQLGKQAIPQWQQQQFMGQQRNATQPLFNQFADSPEKVRAISQQLAPLLLGQSSNIQMANVQGTLDRDNLLRRLMAGMVS